LSLEEDRKARELQALKERREEEEKGLRLQRELENRREEEEARAREEARVREDARSREEAMRREGTNPNPLEISSEDPWVRAVNQLVTTKIKELEEGLNDKFATAFQSMERAQSAIMSRLDDIYEEMFGISHDRYHEDVVRLRERGWSRAPRRSSSRRRSRSRAPSRSRSRSREKSRRS